MPRTTITLIWSQVSRLACTRGRSESFAVVACLSRFA
jgi:hypothetical protein